MRKRAPAHREFLIVDGEPSVRRFTQRQIALILQMSGGRLLLTLRPNASKC